MAILTLNNSVPMLEQRTKINDNFAQVELAANKTNTVTATASTTKYVSEKAAYDYTQKMHYSTGTPVTKDGDLLLFETATGKGKIKYNVAGTLKELVPDRSIVDTKTAAQFTALNATLSAGEIAVESDTRLMKVGDGTTAWTTLPYHSGIKYGKTGNQSYIKHANGMIQQWGSIGIITSAGGILDSVVTLPIPYTESLAYGNAYIINTDWQSAYHDMYLTPYSASQYRFTNPNVFSANAMYDVRYFIVGF